MPHCATNPFHDCHFYTCAQKGIHDFYHCDLLSLASGKAFHFTTATYTCQWKGIPFYHCDLHLSVERHSILPLGLTLVSRNAFHVTTVTYTCQSKGIPFYHCDLHLSVKRHSILPLRLAFVRKKEYILPLWPTKGRGMQSNVKQSIDHYKNCVLSIQWKGNVFLHLPVDRNPITLTR